MRFEGRAITVENIASSRMMAGALAGSHGPAFLKLKIEADFVPAALSPLGGWQEWETQRDRSGSALK